MNENPLQGVERQTEGLERDNSRKFGGVVGVLLRVGGSYGLGCRGGGSGAVEETGGVVLLPEQRIMCPVHG